MMTANLTTVAQAALIATLEELRDAVRGLAAPLSEAEFWKKPLEPGNSMGHLILHLTGNLNHFIGAQIGKTGYVRDREREFTETNLPSKAEALAGLDEAVATFRRVVEGLSAEQMVAAHPEARMGNVFGALVRVLTHFALHRGQTSYVARLVKPVEA